MSDDNPLSIATTKELIDELERRSTALAIAMMPKAQKKQGQQNTDYYYRGGKFNAIGMLQQFAHDLLFGDFEDLQIERGEDDDA